MAQGGLKLSMSSSKMRTISNQGKRYLARKANDKGCFQGADGRGQRLPVLGQKPPWKAGDRNTLVSFQGSDSAVFPNAS